jgi:hypothetical protein
VVVWLLALMLSLRGVPVWAQAGTTTGMLTGTVSSVDGDPLPGVAVRLMNEATGAMENSTSGSDGRYSFLSVVPGTYELRLSVQGYRTANSSAVAVSVSEETVVAARLEAGSADDPIVCYCTVTHSGVSSGGNLMDSKSITSAPLTSRNITQTFVNTAGAAGNVNNAGLLGNSNQSVSVNGQSGGTFTIDGAQSTAAPNPDAVSQFRIQTTQYDSAYGAQVPTTNLLLQSGTNNLHGVVWEFVRNNVLNANDYFSQLAGQPKPDLKQNQFGGALGGRLQRDRLFFFVSYQGTRQVNGLDPTSHSTVNLPPLTDVRTPAALGAQFGLVPLGNNRFASCANPAVPLTGTVRNKTFAGGAQVACDGSNINPVALRILQMKSPDGSYLVPTPQTLQSNGLGRSSFSLPSSWNEDQYIGNLDHSLSSKHTLAGRFLYSHANDLRTFGASNTSPGSLQGGPQTFQSTDYVASLRLKSVLSRNFVNDARVTFSQESAVGIGPGIPTATSLGMVPVDPLFNEAPQMVIQGSLGSFQFLGNISNDQSRPTRSYSWADDVSWIHGKHSIRAGVYYDLNDFDTIDTGQARGKITFQNFTDFLLGQSAKENGSPEGLSNIDSIQAVEGSGPQGDLQNLRRNISWALHVQDDIKLRPRFSLNLGLRWEYLPGTTDRANQMGNFYYSLAAEVPIPSAAGTYRGINVPADYDPNVINPFTGKPFGPPPAGVLVRSTNTLFMDKSPWDLFGPRVSLAWQPGKKQGILSLRAGYGSFFQELTDASYSRAPFAQDFSNSSASNGQSNLQKPFPTTTLGFPLRTIDSQLSDRVFGPDFRVPSVKQWNLTLQLMLIRTLSLSVGYVGSLATHLETAQTRGLNQPLLATPGHPVNCGLPNTAAGLGVSNEVFATLGIDTAGCVTTNTINNAYLRVPILGEAPAALLLNDSFRGSSYNGLQTTLRKQVSRGFSFQASYTFSKSMSDTSKWLNDQNDEGLNRIRTNRVHRMVFSYTYEFPQFLHSGGLVEKLVSGWSASGVSSIQSGNPLTLTDRSAGSVYGRNGTSTITMCPNATYQDLQTSGPESTRLNQWFNTAGVICAAPRIGSDLLATGYGNAARSIVNGPSQNDWDISLAKTTQVGGIREDAQLQLRIEFYNAFNHPQFADPGTTFGSTSSFGIITQTSVAPRLIQLGLKYAF